MSGAILVETYGNNILLHVYSSKFVLEAIYDEPYCKCLKKIKIGSKPNGSYIITDAIYNKAYAEVYNPSDFEMQVLIDMINLQEAYLTAQSTINIYKLEGNESKYVKTLYPNQTLVLFKR